MSHTIKRVFDVIIVAVSFCVLSVTMLLVHCVFRILMIVEASAFIITYLTIIIFNTSFARLFLDNEIFILSSDSCFRSMTH